MQDSLFTKGNEIVTFYFDYVAEFWKFWIIHNKVYCATLRAGWERETESLYSHSPLVFAQPERN